MHAGLFICVKHCPVFCFCWFVPSILRYNVCKTLGFSWWHEQLNSSQLVSFFCESELFWQCSILAEYITALYYPPNLSNIRGYFQDINMKHKTHLGGAYFSVEKWVLWRFYYQGITLRYLVLVDSTYSSICILGSINLWK